MKTIALITVTAFLTGCAAYKVSPTDDEEFLRAVSRAGTEARVTVVREPGPGRGMQCFEPYLYVLSVGIIPTHCVWAYDITLLEGQASGGAALQTTIEVASVQGWVTLLLLPLPKWRFGSGASIEPELEDAVRAVAR
jgi:hypothetical protein